MSGADSTAYDAGTVPRCYRHADRETYISCQRCGRPICPDCMMQASVGFHCPECVREGRATSPQARTSFGGKVSDGSSIVTVALIAVNALVFVLALATGGGNGEFATTLALMPDSSQWPPRFGLEGVAQGSYWQLVTSTFLHVEVLHIALNMIGLWIFGTFLESQLGRWRYLALYLVTGLVGSVAVYWLAPLGSLSYGASGSVFGLFGAALVVLLKQKRDVSQLLLLLGLNLVITFTVGNISWQAHLGGLAAGLAMGAGFAYAPRAQRTTLHVGMTAALVALGVVLVVLRSAALPA